MSLLIKKDFRVASPPDVRKVSDLPEKEKTIRGYAPEVPGRSPEKIKSECRKVKDLPHIGRHSR